MVKHIILFRFVPTVAVSDVDALLVCLYQLQAKIGGLDEVIGGPYQSAEGLNHDYTHALIMTFCDAEARDRYLVHADHEAAKVYLAPYVQDVLVFDFCH